MVFITKPSRSDRSNPGVENRITIEAVSTPLHGSMGPRSVERSTSGIRPHRVIFRATHGVGCRHNGAELSLGHVPDIKQEGQQGSTLQVYMMPKTSSVSGLDGNGLEHGHGQLARTTLDLDGPHASLRFQLMSSIVTIVGRISKRSKVTLFVFFQSVLYAPWGFASPQKAIDLTTKRSGLRKLPDLGASA